MKKITSYKQYLKFFKALFLLSLPTIFFLTRNTPTVRSAEIIFAKVGDKEILVNEFKGRCELIPEHTISKGNKTTFDNLISGKKLISETESNDILSFDVGFESAIEKQTIRKIFDLHAVYDVSMPRQGILGKYVKSGNLTFWSFYISKLPENYNYLRNRDKNKFNERSLTDTGFDAVCSGALYPNTVLGLSSHVT